MKATKEELLKFKLVMEIANILKELSEETYNESKCLFLYRETSEKESNFYKTLFEYVDSIRPKKLMA